MSHSHENTSSSEISLTITKISCMIVFFLLVFIVGSLPLRLSAFETNKKLLSFTSAFAGGLFLSVGLLHLLPEAAENFNEHFEDSVDDVFPFAYLVVILSFTFILFIEKIVTDVPHDHVGDSHKLPLVPYTQEDEFKSQTNAQYIVAMKASFTDNPKHTNPYAPYILQVGIGIHAVFEGISIGIQDDIGICLGVALAVLCHKWAEGLTLGLAFKKASVELRMSQIMIIIQAVMNPIGIGLGWILSQTGSLVVGIFLSISVGTFIYISTVEVIVEEFSIARYKWQKFLIFLIAILFVSSFWFLEQMTDHEH